MDRYVARQPDVFGLLPDGAREQLAKRRFADVTVQVRDRRRRQSLLDLVDTLEQALQSVTGMEAGGSGVPIDVLLRKPCAFRHMRKLLREEREVGGDLHRAQRSPLNARACREAKSVSSSARWARWVAFCCSTDSTIWAKRCWRARGGRGTEIFRHTCSVKSLSSVGCSRDLTKNLSLQVVEAFHQETTIEAI